MTAGEQWVINWGVKRGKFHNINLKLMPRILKTSNMEDKQRKLQQKTLYFPIQALGLILNLHFHSFSNICLNKYKVLKPLREPDIKIGSSFKAKQLVPIYSVMMIILSKYHRSWDRLIALHQEHGYYKDYRRTIFTRVARLMFWSSVFIDSLYLPLEPRSHL